MTTRPMPAIVLLERLDQNIDHEKVKLLQPALTKAIELGLLPPSGHLDDNVKNWENMEAIIRAFLEGAE